MVCRARQGYASSPQQSDYDDLRSAMINHRRWQRGVSRRTGCARVCVYVLVRGVHVPILCDVFGRRSLFITPFAILPWCYYQQRVTDGALPRAAQARSVPEPVARSIKLVHLSLCELAGRAEFERAHREIWAHLSICMLGAHTRPYKLVGGARHLLRTFRDPELICIVPEPICIVPDEIVCPPCACYAP